MRPYFTVIPINNGRCPFYDLSDAALLLKPDLRSHLLPVNVLRLHILLI